MACKFAFIIGISLIGAGLFLDVALTKALKPDTTRETVPLPPLTRAFEPGHRPPPDPVSNIIWHRETVKKGDSLSKIFNRAGVSTDTLSSIMKTMKTALAGKQLKTIKPGQIIQLGYREGTLTRLKFILNPANTLIATRTDNTWQVHQQKDRMETRLIHAHGIVKNSLFAAGNKAGLSDNLIMQMADIFGWDIDFSLDLRKGDRFTVIYEGHYLNAEKISNGDIIAAEFVNQGKHYHAIRYDNPERPGYYASNGRSMRKAFLRAPVKFSRISSVFSKRRWHPVLKKWRAHRGVDYAAPHGTPVHATSHGKIVHIGRKGGYGKSLFIQHGKSITTVYGHLSRYSKALRKGSKVRQGQTIGYVGATGLATGPHLHYELRINGVHRNPLTAKLPKARTLSKKYLADFQSKAAPLLSRLALIHATTYARTADPANRILTN